VITPGSPVDPSRLRAGVALLESLGFDVEIGDHAIGGGGETGASDEERAADFNTMWARDDIAAVFASRGGAGASRILDLIDFEIVRLRPKAFVGYSDNTVVHLALHRFAGLASFYGPMVASEMADGLNDSATDSLLRALAGERPRILNAYTALPRPTTVVPGKANGQLVGGTLCLAICSLGTAYEITTRGRILFFEDHAEPLWRVERMLVHLLHTGKLQAARGFVFGPMRDSNADDSQEFDRGFQRVLSDLILPLGKPALCGFPTGHLPNQLTLPLGHQVELDADEGTLAVL